MHTRWKALAAACAAAFAFSGSSAIAHVPEERGGDPLRGPFGENFWFFANFQTAQNPFNAANTHVTSSDIAFWGDLAYVGDYGGFRIFDVSKPKPKLVSDMRCYGPQGDPSVFDRDGDGDADTLVLSVDSVLAGPQCGAAPVGKTPTTGDVSGRRVGGPAGLRRLRPARPGAGRGRLPGLRLAHQHAAARARRQVDVRAQLELPARRRPDVRPARRQRRAARSTTASSRSSTCRSTTRRGVREVTELPVVYPGDADGTYRPGQRARPRPRRSTTSSAATT